MVWLRQIPERLDGCGQKPDHSRQLSAGRQKHCRPYTNRITQNTAGQSADRYQTHLQRVHDPVHTPLKLQRSHRLPQTYLADGLQ